MSPSKPFRFWEKWFPDPSFNQATGGGEACPSQSQLVKAKPSRNAFRVCDWNIFAEYFWCQPCQKATYGYPASEEHFQHWKLKPLDYNVAMCWNRISYVKCGKSGKCHCDKYDMIRLSWCMLHTGATLSTRFDCIFQFITHIHINKYRL